MHFISGNKLHVYMCGLQTKENLYKIMYPITKNLQLIIKIFILDHAYHLCKNTKTIPYMAKLSSGKTFVVFAIFCSTANVLRRIG